MPLWKLIGNGEESSVFFPLLEVQVWRYDGSGDLCKYREKMKENGSSISCGGVSMEEVVV